MTTMVSCGAAAVCAPRLSSHLPGLGPPRQQVMSEEGKILALKRIKLKKADRATLQAYKNEIDILSSLSGKENIIQMVDSHMDLENKLIYVRTLESRSRCLL